MSISPTSTVAPRAPEHHLQPVRSPPPSGQDPSVAVPRDESTDLPRRLQSRPVIEQAKGIIMGQYGLNADTAFLVLQRWSQDSNLELGEVAEALTTGIEAECCGDLLPLGLVQRVALSHPMDATG